MPLQPLSSRNVVWNEDEESTSNAQGLPQEDLEKLKTTLHHRIPWFAQSIPTSEIQNSPLYAMQRAFLFPFVLSTSLKRSTRVHFVHHLCSQHKRGW